MTELASEQEAEVKERLLRLSGRMDTLQDVLDLVGRITDPIEHRPDLPEDATIGEMVEDARGTALDCMNAIKAILANLDALGREVRREFDAVKEEAGLAGRSFERH